MWKEGMLIELEYKESQPLDDEIKAFQFANNDENQAPPDIFELFAFQNEYFFKHVLDASEIKWSKRMTLCAGTCQLISQGSCRITLSQPLLQQRTNNNLKETILHEMIHAYLFITQPSSQHLEGGHGSEFRLIMQEINSQTGLDVTIQHSFHDEVDIQRKHIWKCNGTCQNKPPFFGIVKRAMNRKPGHYDHWWKKHQAECGGEFVKIASPESSKEEKKKIDSKKASQTNTLDKYFRIQSCSKHIDNLDKEEEKLIQVENSQNSIDKQIPKQVSDQKSNYLFLLEINPLQFQPQYLNNNDCWLRLIISDEVKFARFTEIIKKILTIKPTCTNRITIDPQIKMFIDIECEAEIDSENQEFELLHFYKQLELDTIQFSMDNNVFSVLLKQIQDLKNKDLNPYLLKAIGNPLCISSNSIYVFNQIFTLSKEQINSNFNH